MRDLLRKDERIKPGRGRAMQKDKREGKGVDQSWGRLKVWSQRKQ
jgi:hypothetical protein